MSSARPQITSLAIVKTVPMPRQPAVANEGRSHQAAAMSAFRTAEEMRDVIDFNTLTQQPSPFVLFIHPGK